MIQLGYEKESLRECYFDDGNIFHMISYMRSQKNTSVGIKSVKVKKSLVKQFIDVGISFFLPIAKLFSLNENSSWKELFVIISHYLKVSANV